MRKIKRGAYRKNDIYKHFPGADRRKRKPLFRLVNLVRLLLVLIFFGGIPYLEYRKKVATAHHLVVYEDPVRESTIVFQWAGGVDPPMAKHISSAFKESKKEYDHVLLDLDSPGGSVIQGDEVISVLSRIKRTHKLMTRVSSGNDCLSMCVPIYMQGDIRLAARDSKWMFHRPISVDPLTGVEEFQSERERNTAGFDMYLRYFKTTDMNEPWRENLVRQWQTGDVWKTGQQLKDEKSNIVTILQ